MKDDPCPECRSCFRRSDRVPKRWVRSRPCSLQVVLGYPSEESQTVSAHLAGSTKAHSYIIACECRSFLLTRYFAGSLTKPPCMRSALEYSESFFMNYTTWDDDYKKHFNILKADTLTSGMAIFMPTIMHYLGFWHFRNELVFQRNMKRSECISRPVKRQV
jgi:hypothetical protein